MCDQHHLLSWNPFVTFDANAKADLKRKQGLKQVHLILYDAVKVALAYTYYTFKRHPVMQNLRHDNFG